MPCRVAFAAAALLLLAASARAEEVDSPQAEPAAASRVEAAGAPRAEAPAQRLTDPPLPGDAVKDETADDPDAQAEVDKSAAELEAVRKAEEKAGLLPRPPGAGAHDGLQVGVDAFDPLARDLATALGSGLDGAPLADPAPAGSVSARLPELLGISEDELRAKYDIPVELNDAVVAYIRFFQTDTREAFGRWLARSTRYLPMMRQVLEKRGLPLDLVYLSMIESGFSSYAYSFAKAAGLWQFMVGTSRRYGLHTDFWVDERRDPAKSTEAAARYLSDLRARYHGDWYLAWAGYNAGEGKVDRAIRNDKSKDFWMLMGKGRTLRAETKHYVPKLIAAALIAKHPERFGFHVNFEPPAEVDEVQVPDATDLHVIAKAAGVTFEQVRDLNPELRRFCTPPGGWKLRLPKGTRETFAAEYEKLGPGDRLRFVEHKVEKGEPIAKIARAYGVAEAAILRTNGIKNYRQIKPGRMLVIPMAGASRMLAGAQLEDRRGGARAAVQPQARRPLQLAAATGETTSVAAFSVAASSVAASSVAASSAAASAVAQAKAGTYRVKPGDSLWTIAARFSTTVDKLKRLNGLNGRRARALQVGQTIAVSDS